MIKVPSNHYVMFLLKLYNVIAPLCCHYGWQKNIQKLIRGMYNEAFAIEFQ